MDGAKIVIAYHDKAISQHLGQILFNAGHRPTLLSKPGDIQACLEKDTYDMVLLGDDDPQWDGLRFFKLALSCEQPIVIGLAAIPTVPRAVAFLNAGAADYLTVSAQDELMLESISRALLTKKNDHSRSEHRTNRSKPVLTTSPVMESVLDAARQVAQSTATVLIQGESGTGKELLARMIHDHSGRPQDLFVAINCAALPDTLAESELFGYEKGAFTGAGNMKTGKFEQAHKGTLLLDEISEMPLGLQAKLLRAIQEKKVDRIGGMRSVEVDVRFLATTNRDLPQMVKQGSFRDDLYYRLRVIPLKIPPLRDRRDDIPLLVDSFLKKYCPSDRKPAPSLSAAAMNRLRRWPWPGNVRELENTIERAVLISNGKTIGPEHLLLEDEIGQDTLAEAAPLVGMTVRAMEQKLISQTLSHVNHNRTHAAKLLGISIRTLRNKLRELDNPLSHDNGR